MKDVDSDLRLEQTDDSSQTLPTSDYRQNDRRLRRIGYAVGVFLIFGLGGWAACAPLESAALAPAVVQVIGKRKAVQHLEGGIVAEIRVASGDLVTAGQPLVLLDATRDKAEMMIAQGRIYNMQAAADRLSAERDGTDDVTFSESLRAAIKIDSRAEAAVSRENSLFSVRLADRLGEKAVLDTRRQGLALVISAKQRVAESLEQEMSDLAELLEDGYVDKQRIRQLERDQAELYGQIADLEVSLQKVGLEILQLEKIFKTKVVDELSATLEELYDLERKYEAISDRVNRATITAPVSGEVIDLRLNAIGAVIGSGETIMELVPASDGIFIEARVSPMDIDRVRVGQPAEIRFSVFKDAYLVSGVLTKISADRLIDQASDMAYYEAEINLFEEDLKLLGDVELIPGMPAEALIKTGQRTMLGYITSPLSRMFSRSLTED